MPPPRRHWPVASSHSSLAAQVPHENPHPSSPQPLPLQAAWQGHEAVVEPMDFSSPLTC